MNSLKKLILNKYFFSPLLSNHWCFVALICFLNLIKSLFLKMVYTEMTSNKIKYIIITC